MTSKIAVFTIAFAAAALPAFAQEAEVTATPTRHAARAPDRAWEFAVGAGYSQGVGDVGSNSPTLTDLSHGGGEVHAAGGRVIAWTVNDPAAAVALARLGVDALCTDVPDVVGPAVARALGAP